MFEKFKFKIDILYKITINLTVLFIILKLIDIFKFININQIINFNLFFLIIIILITISSINWFKYNKLQKFNKLYIRLLFLISLTILFFNSNSLYIINFDFISNSYILLILFSLGIFSFYFLIKHNTNKKLNISKKNKLDYIILFSFILIGFLIRLMYLGEISFWWDEFIHIFAAKGLTFPFFQPYLGSNQLYFRSIITTLITFFATQVFNFTSEFMIRFFFVILSSFSSILLYFISIKFISKKSSLLLVLINSLSLGSIILSQEVRYYSILSFLLLLFYLIIFTKINIYLKIVILSIISFFGLNSSMLFFPFIIIPPIIFLVDNFKDLKKYLLILLIFTPILIYKGLQILLHIIKNNFFEGQIIVFNSNYIISLVPLLIMFLFFLNIFFIKKNKYIFLPVFFLLITISLINTKFSGALRHTTFLIPIILLNAFIVIDYISLNFDKKTVFFIIAILLTTYLLNIGDYMSNSKFRFDVKEKFTWKRPSYNLWESLVNVNQTIISNMPQAALYYSGKVDYCIRDFSNEDVELYTGTKVSNSSIIYNKECFYLLIDYKAKYHIKESSLDFIYNNLELINQSKGVWIYRSSYC